MRQWFFVLGLCVVWGFGAAQASEPGGAVPPASGSNDVEEDPRLLSRVSTLGMSIFQLLGSWKDLGALRAAVYELGEALQNVQGIHSDGDADNLEKGVRSLAMLWKKKPDLGPDVEHLLSDEVPLFRDWREGVPTGIEHFDEVRLHSLVESFFRTERPAPQAIFAAWEEGVPDSIAFWTNGPGDRFNSIFAVNQEEMPESVRNALRGREVFGSLGAGNPCEHLSRVFNNTTLHFLGGEVDPEVGLGDWDIYFQRADLLLRLHLDPSREHARLEPVGLLRIAGAFAVQTGEVPDGVEDALRETVSNLTANQNTCERLRDALEQGVPLAQRLSSIYAATAIGGIVEEAYALPCPVHPRLSVERLPAEGRTGSVLLD